MRCAVLGSPIEHSLSPTLHRAAYETCGLDWTYDAIDVNEEGLQAFLAGLDDTWRGLSLTMPLKRAVLPLLDEVTDAARRAGAANTVIRDSVGRLLGDNTDVPGAVAAIGERLASAPGNAVVLGGGATAGSMLLALADLGCDSVALVVRDPSRAREAVEAAKRHRRPAAVSVHTFADIAGHLGDVDLLISTIPASAQRDVVLALAEQAGAVFEVVYDPWPTPLAAYAIRAGLPLVSGLDLLVHQAALQFTQMTGVLPAPLETMRAAGEEALAQRWTEHA
jgi:shikimate dehydrogenase